MTPVEPPAAADTATDARPPRAPRNWPAVAVVLLVLGVVAGTLAGVAYVVHQPEPGRAAAMTTTSTMTPMVAPAGVLDLATVQPAIAVEYRYSAAHASAYGQLRCWCGCVNAYAHRSLADCFQRPDGAWEAHGAGCGVCLGEAMAAHNRLDAGASPSDIAKELDAQYGPPPNAPNGA